MNDTAERAHRQFVYRDWCRGAAVLVERCPERTVDAGNETDIRSVVVFVGNEA